jgi:hypothetical protein
MFIVTMNIFFQSPFMGDMYLAPPELGRRISAISAINIPPLRG